MNGDCSSFIFFTMILINSSPKDTLKSFQPFLSVAVPIGIGFLISHAARHNIKIHCVDEQIEEDALQRIISLTSTMKAPYIFGFSVLTAALESALILSKQLKEIYPDCIIMFGGIHPTAMPDEVLSYPHIDVVVRGEGERPIVEFYNAIKNHKDHTKILGLSYKSNGNIIHNVRDNTPVDLSEETPFPYYLFKNKKYDLGYVTSSRGCPYDCIFCSNRIATGKKYRYRSSSLIVQELKTLHNKFNINHVGFFDDNFLVNKARIYELIQKIKDAHLHEKITFSFQARADNVDEKILRALYECGFNDIFFGIETASEDMMLTIKKGETVKQCVHAVHLAKSIGYKVNATFIYALPTDSHSTRMQCIDLSNALQLNLVRFNNATPYPGTELYDIALSQDRLHIEGIYKNFNAVSTISENPFDPTPFAYVPPNDTESCIRRDILYSYFSFYINKTRLSQVFNKSSTNSGWFNVGKNIIPIALLFFVLFLKFIQLFYYSVLKPDTRISLKFFLSIFKRNLYHE